MTWNKTDSSATDPDQPVSSWLAARLLTNTDDLTRESRTGFQVLTSREIFAEDSVPWMASNSPRPLIVWCPISPESSVLRVTVPGETRKLLADVEVDVGYGLPNGATKGWTGYRMFSSGPGVIDEEVYTLDLTEAHQSQLREIPILVRIRSLESTDPADIDITLTLNTAPGTLEHIIEPWWAEIGDETALLGYARNDAFSFTFSGIKQLGGGKTEAFLGVQYGSSDSMIHYRQEEDSNTATLHYWPAQDANIAETALRGTTDIHLTLLGSIRIHGLSIEQDPPISLLPYLGVGATPLASIRDGLQAVAPDMPTRYQTDLLTHRAQKYLVAERPPVISVGPLGGEIPPVALNLTAAESVTPLLEGTNALLHIPLDQSPTRVQVAGVERVRKSIDVVLWLSCWSSVPAESLALVDISLELLEVDTTALLTPSYQPVYISHHTETVQLQPIVDNDPDGYMRRIKAFPSTRSTGSSYPAEYTPLQRLWPRWSMARSRVTRVEFTIQDPVAGNVHDYLRVTLGRADDSGLPCTTQCVGWYITEARGQSWDNTTEEIP